jgi:hypothetical protein
MPAATLPSPVQAIDEERMDTVLAIHERLSPALRSHPLIVKWRQQAREYERLAGHPCPPLVLRIRP